MHTGIVHLDSLIRYVTLHDRIGRALEPRSPAGDQYDKLAETVVSNIARERGLYLWGTYAPNGLWSNVYVGKASLGKTVHLYARILEELKDERVFLWGHILADAEIRTLGARYHPRMWHAYERHWERSLRKAGASKIVWVAVPELDNAEVHSVAADLIEALNPRANLQRPRPSAGLQPFTKDVIGHLRTLIHVHRPQGVPKRMVSGDRTPHDA